VKDFLYKFLLSVIAIMIVIVLLRLFFWLFAIAVLLAGIIWIVIKIIKA
jgi:hypothetical protein